MQGVKALESYLMRDPQNQAALSALCQLLVDKRQFSKALPYLEKLLALKPKDSQVLQAMAICLAETGDLAGAMERQRAAVDLSPKPRFLLSTWARCTCAKGRPHRQYNALNKRWTRCRTGKNWSWGC